VEGRGRGRGGARTGRAQRRSGGRPQPDPRAREWEGGATFRVSATTPLAFEVLQRGASETAPNELTLERAMWFDMDGSGWSVVDDLRGRMHHGARLDLRAGALGSVVVNGKPQVVTVGVDGTPGVEVRASSSTCTRPGARDARDRAAGRRLVRAVRSGPRCSVELPRGWDVLRASGPGSMRSTWIESWRPLDLLLLLGVCVLIGRVVSPWIGVAALLGLGLAYTRSGDGYVELVLLIGIVTVLAAQLRRDRGPWATRALQWLWIAGAGLLAAWMIWTVPVGVREVWQGGDSALAHRDLERELGELAELEAAGVALVLAVYGFAWMVARARGRAHKAAIAFTVLVGGAMVVGLALVTMKSDMIAAPSRVAEEEPTEEWESRTRRPAAPASGTRARRARWAAPTSGIASRGSTR
jgi:hypothetical protein